MLGCVKLLGRFRVPSLAGVCPFVDGLVSPGGSGRGKDEGLERPHNFRRLDPQSLLSFTYVWSAKSEVGCRV